MAETAKPGIALKVPHRKRETDPDRLRWGTVSTIKAPLQAIARFAAYHLDLGAALVDIYLDEPDPQVVEFFAPHPRVRLTQCDDAYWQDKPERARSSHQLRQAFNASRAYRKSDLHWLTHIDVDEFLIAPRPMAEILAAVAPEAAFARVRPAELLAQPDPWRGPSHFKLTRRELGLTKAELVRIYPDYGAYVPEGFLGYTGGKNIARTGLPQIRLGIHAVLHKGQPITNFERLPEVHLGHAHAPDWTHFERHLKFRMNKGSYREKLRDRMRLRDVIDIVIEDSGTAGLRRFYDELNAATPELLERLAAHGMLLTASLDLDEKVARWFGDLP
ncbi:glycosyltransferase family 2 protein [Pseudodonghicola flavimaris]|uniref:Glycosyltransferase family 2 protein n=1 Tax=Pseudodonghicola flavimaris TaxID=3050036 RepID=A0ABT7EV56_9RHOB|nr:glycosyltransferase family 2 protein [Pseudodonghicola flavimaris]MDK3016215.1 glycosyltransferase family 2 protein [Pseudodonghicola flavimaris]